MCVAVNLYLKHLSDLKRLHILSQRNVYVRSAIRFLWYVLIKVLLCALQCEVVHILFIFLVTYNAPDFDVFNMSVLCI